MLIDMGFDKNKSLNFKNRTLFNAKDLPLFFINSDKTTTHYN